MATRIGKYKVSKRESAISLVDGGTVNQKLTFTSKVIVTGLSTDGTAGSSLSTGELYTTSSAILGGGSILTAGASAWTASGHSIVCMSS